MILEVVMYLGVFGMRQKNSWLFYVNFAKQLSGITIAMKKYFTR